MNQESLGLAVRFASELQNDISAFTLPPSAGIPSREEPIVYMALVRKTRGYLERVSDQINGTYVHGCYDACLVMIRRLIETLLIECFEAYQLADSIKDANGDYKFLRDLVDAALTEKSWQLGRSVRKGLPTLKDVGDKSAHSRRFNAHREDVDKIAPLVRETVQELVSLARLR
jgi:hypothetical protein